MRLLTVGLLLTSTLSFGWVTRTCPTNSSLRPSYASNSMWPFWFQTNMPVGNVWRTATEQQMVEWNSIQGAADVLTVLSGTTNACSQPMGTARTTIGWDDGSCYTWGANTLGITQVFTQGCLITRQEVYFNADVAFSNDEFADTALHELGHALGAGHEWNDVAIMGYGDEPLLFLTADDHAFMRNLWPSGSTVAPDLYVTRMVLRNPVLPNVQSMVLAPAPTCSGGCSNLRAGHTISVTATYGNAGSRAVSGVLEMELRLGTHVIGTWTVSNYPAHGQDTFTFVATVPTGIPPGSYALTLELDPANRISQSSGPTAPDFLTFSGFQVAVPAGWTCSSSRYGAGDGCDCECGIVDPDCSSTSPVARGCSDSNPCTDDRCSSLGQCLYVNNTATCEDGSYCTVNDRCSNGACGAGPARDCSSQTSSCSTGSCDEATDRCVRTPLNEGGSCSDARFCTVGDVCVQGTCTGTARDCSSLNTTCAVGRCDEPTARCVAAAANEGATCSDGLSCTVVDVCRAGTCSGRQLDCSSLSTGCLRGSCDPATGQCVALPVADGLACDDGAFCTQGETCLAGACQGGVPRVCGSTTCASGICDETANRCASVPINEGGSCDDGAFCTVTDRCVAGACTGTTMDCSALTTACTAGFCDESGRRCRAAAAREGQACDDADGCTDRDACVSGLCRGSAKSCGVSASSCQVGFCDAATGQCSTRPKADGASCSDGFLCTTRDTCQAGTCIGAAVNCASSDGQCTVGACNEATGACVATPKVDGTSCNDALGCTLNDACAAGRCVGQAKACASLDGPCTVGQCDATTGACRAVPVKDGLGCDDGSLCTLNDSCSAGVCSGTTSDCAPFADRCQTATCEPSTGRCLVQGLRCEDQRPSGCGCGSADGLFAALAWFLARRKR